MRDGDTVVHRGDDPDYPGLHEGMVLSAEAGSCHVKWTSGVRTGQITLCLSADLQRSKSPVQVSREASLLFEDEAETSPEGAEEDLPLVDDEEEIRSTGAMTSLASDIREHALNLILNDPILAQAMADVGEEAMLSMVLSEANDE